MGQKFKTISGYNKLILKPCKDMPCNNENLKIIHDAKWG